MPYLNLPGLRLFYERHGTGNPPLVFVHGFACAHADWQHQVAFFQASNSVVACDLPGHGASGHSDAHCSIESFGADVAALLAALELPPAVLVGHSMGCRVVLQAYLDAPQHVAGLVLLDGSSMGQGDPQAVEQHTAQHMRETGYTTVLHTLFDGMFVEPSPALMKERIIARALALPEAIGLPLFSRLMGWDARHMEATLAQVAVPLLVLQSTYVNPQRVRVSLQPDATTPWTELVRQRVPTAQIEVLPHLGHFPMLEAPQAVNQSIAAFIATFNTA
jgi:pimeloyl-ACP methyl ester carboxylesterase